MNTTLDETADFVAMLFATTQKTLCGREAPKLPEAFTEEPPRPLTCALARASSCTSQVGEEAALQDVLHSTAARNLLLLAALKPVVKKFEDSGIRWAALKGIDHLARLYPGLEWREMADVDLLVHREDVGAAQALLKELGFDPWAATPSVQPGRCYSDGVVSIDLHRRLVRRGGFVEDTGWLLENTRLGQLAECPVRLMEPPQALTTSALFLAKDGFLAKMVRAERVVELGLLAESAGLAGEGQAWARLAQWGAVRVARCARDLLTWLRGGARPSWLEKDFGGSTAGFGEPPSLTRRLIRGAWLQGSARQAAGWTLAQSWNFMVHRASGRRWASWDAEF
jgi:hypothetical protein